MSDIEKEFQKYSQEIKKIKTKPSDKDLLILYGLYKQSTIGDCNTEKPGFLKFKEKSKWESWNSYKGKNKEDSMKLYINKAKSIINN